MESSSSVLSRASSIYSDQGDILVWDGNEDSINTVIHICEACVAQQRSTKQHSRGVVKRQGRPSSTYSVTSLHSASNHCLFVLNSQPRAAAGDPDTPRTAFDPESVRSVRDVDALWSTTSRQHSRAGRRGSTSFSFSSMDFSGGTAAPVLAPWVRLPGGSSDDSGLDTSARRRAIYQQQRQSPTGAAAAGGSSDRSLSDMGSDSKVPVAAASPAGSGRRRIRSVGTSSTDMDSSARRRAAHQRAVRRGLATIASPRLEAVPGSARGDKNATDRDGSMHAPSDEAPEFSGITGGKGGDEGEGNSESAGSGAVRQGSVYLKAMKAEIHSFLWGSGGSASVDR
uniref:Uncharacterized protein n=1 Tax=Heterosigma akashiwo TaxID=2829 RepID=A0A7S3XMX9_HETAK